MTRETKLGMLMVLVLVAVFGFLVYKRAMRPDDVLAQTDVTQTEDDETEVAGEDAADKSVAKTDFEDFSEQPVSSPPVARAIPETSGETETDLFEAPVSTPARTVPSLPTMVAADDEPAETFDEPAQDEFAAPSTVAISTPASNAPEIDDTDPFAAPVGNKPAEQFDSFESADVAVSQPAETTTVDEPAEDLFAAPVEKKEIVEREPPVIAEPKTVSNSPALSFDPVESVSVPVSRPTTTETEDFATSNEPEPMPVVATPVSRQPAAPTSAPADEFDDEPTVSVRARAELPEPTFDFEEEATTEAEVTAPALSTPSLTTSTPIPAIKSPAAAPVESSSPELLLDDSDEDRYGGYEPIELMSQSQVAPSLADTTVSLKTESPKIVGDTYTIQPGDNFWSIAQKKYGAGRYFQALAAYNRNTVADAGKMKPGVEIALPPVEELESRHASLIPGNTVTEPVASNSAPAATGELLTGNDGQPLYRVGSGDTLSGIAQKYLGRSRRWEQILEMNRDVLKDGNSLKLGSVLRLPADASQVQLSNQPRLFR